MGLADVEFDIRCSKVSIEQSKKTDIPLLISTNLLFLSSIIPPPVEKINPSFFVLSLKNADSINLNLFSPYSLKILSI